MIKLVTLLLIAGVLPSTVWLLFTGSGPVYASGLLIMSACIVVGLGSWFLRQYRRKRKYSAQPEDHEWRRIEKERYLLAKEAILERARQRRAVKRQRVVIR